MFNYIYKVWVPTVKAELNLCDFNDANKKKFQRKVAGMADVTVSVDVTNVAQGAIPPGTLVRIAFADTLSLANPQIIEIVTPKAVAIDMLFKDPPGRPFKLGGPMTVGDATSDPQSHGGAVKKAGRYSGETVETTSLKRAPDRGTEDRFPGSVWMPSYRFTAGRKGKKPSHIFIHTTETGDQGAIDALRGFQAKTGRLYNRKASINYIVKRDGTVVSLVSDSDTAWHAGTSSKRAGDRKIYSHNSIGIEIVGYAAAPGTWNNANVATLARLLKYLSDKFDIPLKYEGLPPGNYTGNIEPYGHPTYAKSKGRVKKPQGTGEQVELSRGLIAHGRATPGRRYDPGVHFPYEKVLRLARSA